MANDKLENARLKYKVAMDRYNAEGQIQWTRYSAMLLVNTILIGLIGFTYSKEVDFPIFFKTLVPFTPVLGLFLCYLWHLMTEKGFIWMNFWITEARKLEKQLVDEDKINPINNGNDFKSIIGGTELTRCASSWIIKIFALVYFLLLIGNIYSGISFDKPYSF